MPPSSTPIRKSPLARSKRTDAEKKLLRELHKHAQTELGFSSKMPIMEWRLNNEQVPSLDFDSVTHPLAMDWNMLGKTPWTMCIARRITDSFLKAYPDSLAVKDANDVHAMMLAFLERQKAAYRKLHLQETGSVPILKKVKRTIDDLALENSVIVNGPESQRKRKKLVLQGASLVEDQNQLPQSPEARSIPQRNLSKGPTNAAQTSSSTLREDLPPPAPSSLYTSEGRISLDDIVTQLERIHLTIEDISIKSEQHSRNDALSAHMDSIVPVNSDMGEIVFSEDDVLDRHFFQATVRQYPDALAQASLLDSSSVKQLAIQYLRDMESKENPYLNTVASKYRNKRAVHLHFQMHNQYKAHIVRNPVMPSVKQEKRRAMRSKRLLKSRMDAAKLAGDTSLQRTLEHLGADGMSSVESDEERGTSLKGFSPIWRSKELAGTFRALDEAVKSSSRSTQRLPSTPSTYSTPPVLCLPFNFYEQGWLHGLEDDACQMVKNSALETQDISEQFIDLK